MQSEYWHGISAASGILGGVILMFLWNWLKSRNTNIISIGILKKLNLDSGDEKFAMAFTYSKSRRLQLAEDKLTEVNEMIKKKESDVASSEDHLADMRKKLQKIIDKIRDQETQGQKENYIKTNLAGQLKLMADETMEYSTALDSHIRFRTARRFWKQVSTGETKKVSIESLLDRPAITGDMDNALTDVLKTANETLSLSDGDFTKAMEKWVQTFDNQ